MMLPLLLLKLLTWPYWLNRWLDEPCPSEPGFPTLLW